MSFISGRSETLAFENMAEMSATVCTGDFSSGHTERNIIMAIDGAYRIV
jgi:hypothetical protein